MPQTSQATLQQQFKITNYIGLVMIGSVFIFAFLVLAIDKGYFSFLENGNQKVYVAVVTKIKYLFILISVVIFLIIKFMKNYILRFFQKQYTKSLYPQVLPLFALTLLVFALCETISIYGLVLFILSRNPNDFFIFMAISLLYFYLFYPKYADWERISKQKLQTNPSR
jgi:F0F1-type ATP synthase membrane subunit c/vacuolar-type H+-ATPase subunit K